MASKKLIMLGMFIGSCVGGYVPSLFGISSFSITSLFASGVGAIIGIWIGYKLGQ